jgi:hypothetical protein
MRKAYFPNIPFYTMHKISRLRAVALRYRMYSVFEKVNERKVTYLLTANANDFIDRNFITKIYQKKDNIKSLILS